MKLTNKLGLPQPIVDAVKNDGYTKNGATFSVTQLIAPPRIVALREQHEEQIVEDASDRIWSLLGQSIHSILERANATGIAERRLTIEIEGVQISGGMDLFEQNGTLSDYKVTTAWKFKDNMVPMEFEQQLNCYAEILRQNGDTVKALQIVGILRDWSKLEANRDPSFPQSQVLVLPVSMWLPEMAQKFMRDRVILHKQARISLPLCSQEERWAKPDMWAVMKMGAKRATRLYEDKEEAFIHAGTDRSLYVEERPGESTRCRFYCPVSPFCEQYRIIREASSDKSWRR